MPTYTKKPTDPRQDHTTRPVPLTRVRRSRVLVLLANDDLRTNRVDGVYGPDRSARHGARDCGTGTISARSNLGATWRRACMSAGVPQVRLHDLHHVAQVIAAEAGATILELMARLGHATPAAALVYLHARQDRDTQLTLALAAAMVRTGRA